MASGEHVRPDLIEEHLRHVSDNSDMPIIVFQFPLFSGLSYPLSTLVGLCDRVPTIRAVKDEIGDGNQHERDTHELHALDNPVNMLTTQSALSLGSRARFRRAAVRGR